MQSQELIPLWPNDAIWWHRSGSTGNGYLPPSHYLNLYWLLSSEVLWHSLRSIYNNISVITEVWWHRTFCLFIFHGTLLIYRYIYGHDYIFTSNAYGFIRPRLKYHLCEPFLLTNQYTLAIDHIYFGRSLNHSRNLIEPPRLCYLWPTFDRHGIKQSNLLNLMKKSLYAYSISNPKECLLNVWLWMFL